MVVHQQEVVVVLVLVRVVLLGLVVEAAESEF
jgi:hypothetical protein